jgi:two-component system chemotaxis sensor kinase CheA
MEEAQKYRDQFLSTINEIELNLTFILEDWDNYLKGSEGIDELYRMVHSLKSGAAFLDLIKIEECSHEVEDGIELYKKSESSSHELKNLVDHLLDNLEGAGKLTDRGPQEFSAHELELFEEARIRGEQIYRLSCFIDPSEPMKKARAFLIQNNLEISFNVIKTVPSLRDETDFSLFTVYLSTSERKDSLRRAVDVDRINEIRIDIFSLQDNEPAIEPEILLSSPTPKRHPVSVEMDRLDEIRIYLEELTRTLGKRNKRAHELAGGIDRVLESLLYERLFNMGRGMELYLEKLCDRYGKNITLSWEGENFLIPLAHMQPLHEIFQQLIRNSLHHGILEQGKIFLKGRKEGEKRVILFSDNGRGINEEGVRKKSNDYETPLLDLICQTGFTTLSSSNSLSGRGMGLNIVKHNTELLGGRLELEVPREEGLHRGVTFRIVLPGESTLSLLQFRVGRHIASVPLSFVERELPLNHRLLKKNIREKYFYRHDKDHLPLYELNRPVDTLDAMRRARFIIIVGYLKKKYALLADELLLERAIPLKELGNMLYINPADLER